MAPSFAEVPYLQPLRHLRLADIEPRGDALHRGGSFYWAAQLVASKPSLAFFIAPLRALPPTGLFTAS